MKVVGPLLAGSVVRRQLASPAAGITVTLVENGNARYIIAVSSNDKMTSNVPFAVDPDIRSAAILFENRVCIDKR